PDNRIRHRKLQGISSASSSDAGRRTTRVPGCSQRGGSQVGGGAGDLQDAKHRLAHLLSKRKLNLVHSEWNEPVVRKCNPNLERARSPGGHRRPCEATGAPLRAYVLQVLLRHAIAL